MSNLWDGKSVLVVDDIKAVREELSALYSKLGMKVAGTAINGIEALDFLHKTPVDLVSLDIIMPEMDGIECYRKIRQAGTQVRCVFISWLAGDPKVAEALKSEIPAELFHGKPAVEHSLRERLQRVFAQPQLHELVLPQYQPEPETPAAATSAEHDAEVA